MGANEIKNLVHAEAVVHVAGPGGPLVFMGGTGFVAASLREIVAGVYFIDFEEDLGFTPGAGPSDPDVSRDAQLLYTADNEAGLLPFAVKGRAELTALPPPAVPVPNTYGGVGMSVVDAAGTPVGVAFEFSLTVLRFPTTD